MTKSQLIERFEKNATIEDDVGSVFVKYREQEKASTHFHVARAWREAASELRDLDDDDKTQ